jgi:probable rRNA maturation factor
MILLDPDLDANPALKATSAKRMAASAARKKSPGFRLPSARMLARFLAAAQAAVHLRGQVTVLLTTDAAIRELNRRFLGKNKATDVLSFPAEGIGAEEIAGDVAISVTTALRHAAVQGHSLSTEIKVLILHGLLHLAGYDHEADDGRMANRERLLRARLGLPQGLIERADFNVKGTGFSPYISPAKSKRVLQVAEKLNPEGDRGPRRQVFVAGVEEGGFNPGIKPIKSRRALAPEERSSEILRGPGKPRTSTRVPPSRSKHP